MCKYEMDPTRTVGAIERTRDAGQTDRLSETNMPPNNFVTTSLCVCVCVCVCVWGGGGGGGGGLGC